MPVNLPAPSTLQDIFSMNPGAFNQAQGMLDMGMQQGQADLRKTQLQNMFDEQNDPLRVQSQRLSNEGLEAQIPGMRADSQIKGMNADKQRELQPDAIAAARSKFLKEASDDDIAQLENHARGMAMSKDESVRKQGEFLLGQTKDMLKERQKNSFDIGKIQESGNQARQTQQQAIDAGKFKKGGASGQDALEKALVSGAWDKAATAYDAMAQRALEAGDQEMSMYYATKAKEYSDKFILSRTSAKPGGVDVGAVGGVPTNPQPTVPMPAMPGQQNNPASASPNANQAIFAKAFGGYEPEKYDYRIGPNGVPQRKLKGK